MTEEYRFIGKRTPRKDAHDIVTGKARFADDLKIPDLLHGKILRSPYPHALIREIDTGAAEAMPDVKAVLTYKNVPDWRTGFPRYVPVLDRRLRFVGDAVALVAARSEEAARQALETIRVEYEVLPAV